MAAPETRNGRPARVSADRAFKALYSHPRMVEDALRVLAAEPDSLVAAELLDVLDFATLAKLPTEWVTEDFRVRHGDQAWRVDWRDGRGFLVVLLEFQSRPDPDMATRLTAYALELHRDLEARGVVARGGPRPPLLPVVVHNGDSPWGAPARSGPTALPAGLAGERLAAQQPMLAFSVLDFATRRGEAPLPDSPVSLQIAFEHARGAAEFEPPLRALLALDDRELARKMYAWVVRLFRRRRIRAPRWKELEELMAATGPYFRSRLDRTLEELQEQGMRRGVEQGMRRGVERGIALGLARERALLRRQAARRFGAAVAERLAERLEGVSDAERLAEIGEAVVDCATPGELLQRLDGRAAARA